ncbi:hypothetical protein ACOSQ2_018717 [Xanthoceras sorbifolium]
MKQKKLQEFIDDFESMKPPDTKYGKLSRLDIYEKGIYNLIRNWTEASYYRMLAMRKDVLIKGKRFAVGLQRYSHEILRKI